MDKLIYMVDFSIDKGTHYLFISIMVFAIFNPVTFTQYMTWIPPLALISLIGYMKDAKTKGA